MGRAVGVLQVGATRVGVGLGLGASAAFGPLFKGPGPVRRWGAIEGPGLARLLGTGEGGDLVGPRRRLCSHSNLSCWCRALSATTWKGTSSVFSLGRSSGGGSDELGSGLEELCHELSGSFRGLFEAGSKAWYSANSSCDKFQTVLGRAPTGLRGHSLVASRFSFLLSWMAG